jgi:hypothetical protein
MVDEFEIESKKTTPKTSKKSSKISGNSLNKS